MTGFELLVSGFLIGGLLAFALTQDYYEHVRRMDNWRRERDWRWPR